MEDIFKRESALKSFLDGRWTWDTVLGPLYNSLILRTAKELDRRFIDEIIPDEGAQILDVGAGPGFVTLQIARENPAVSIIGIDYSSTQVRTANRFRVRDQIPNCRFWECDAMDLPFKHGSFDIVISVASMKHWPDAEKGLQEIWRVLAPGGRSFITEADREATDTEIHRFSSKFTAWYVWDRLMKWFLYRVVFGESYTQKEAESMARSAGFSPVLIERISGWPFFLMKLKK